MTRRNAIVSVLIGASCYGLLSPLVKLAYQDGYDPQAVTMGQFLISFVLVFAAAHFYRNHYRKLTRKSVALLVILGIVSSGTTIFYYEALQFVSSSIGIVLLFQFTWMVVVIHSVVTRVMPSMRQWLSVLLILIGTICAVKLQGQGAAGSAAAGSSATTIGYLLGLLSAVTYAVYLVLLERVH
ncbi:MAG: hypothetical protein JWN30_2231, partial [Bacilli bacterium]|nr:hypothetical protein [Bacilli bacterium]